MNALSMGWRQFRKAPVSSATAVLVQALGIAGTIVLFSLVSGVYRSRPSGVDTAGDELAQLRLVESSSTFFEPSLGKFPYAVYVAYREQSTTLSGVAASMGLGNVTVSVHQRAEGLKGALSSSNYLSVLGVRPVVGRGFTVEEERPGGEAVCLLSERFARRWALQESVPGATLIAHGKPTTVVGILPEAFRGTNYSDRAEIWFPLGQQTLFFPSGRLFGWDWAPFQLVARLKPGVRRQTAAVETTTILRQQERSHSGAESTAAVVVEPLLAHGYIERLQLLPVYGALGLAAALMLAMATFNVAGLGMALGVRRQRDVAIRLSVGASPNRIVLERLAEGLCTGLIAGGGGLALAKGILGVLGSVVTSSRFRSLVESASLMNWQMPGFVLGASMLTALVSGLLPAWSAGRVAPMLVLQAGDWTRRRGLGVRTSVLVGQTAVVTLLALLGAAAARSLWKAQAIPPGFDTRGLVLARVDPIATGYDVPKALAFARRLFEQINLAPQSHTATLSRLAPINPSTVSDRIAIVDPVGAGDTPLGTIAYDEVAPNYFEVMGIPLVMGRSFSQADTPGGTPVLIINTYAARHWPWPNGSPIGSLVRFGSAGTYTVVGVVGDVRFRGALWPPEPFAYVPLFQRTKPSVFDNFGITINLRSRGNLDSATSALRLAVRALDFDLPVEEPRSVATVMRDPLSFGAMIGVLNSVFGVLALLVCSVGFYATAWQIATEREREFGVRMALGARHIDVILLVLRWWLITVGTGLAIGLASGALLALAIAGTPAVLCVDGLVIGSVCTIILAASLSAIGVPLWRVLRTDPATTLRLPAESP